MRLTILLILFVSQYVIAQNPELKYFAKVPTRYKDPGLSPMQSIRFGYLRTPANHWVRKAVEMKFDLMRIKFSDRGSVVFSGALWGNYKFQKRNFYKINDEKAYEQTQYYYFTPALSAGVSYGFFFPYFISFKIGIIKPWEGAYYKAIIPVQYSDSDGISTHEVAIEHKSAEFASTKVFFNIELYRPFRSRSKAQHPMGWSFGYNLFPSDVSVVSGWHFGLYWHVKAK